MSSLPPPVRYTKAGSANIAYQIVGDGPVDLVLALGAWTHLELAWEVPPLRRFLERLSSFSRLIFFDKRGTGLSDRLAPEESPTLTERMEDIVAVMDAARSELALLFGTLGASAIAGNYAVMHPDRTLGLVVYGAYPKLGPGTGMLSRIADDPERALDRIEREWGTEAVTLAFWAPSAVTDEELKSAHLRLARSALSPGAARTMMEMGFRADWEAIMPSIRVPTLVLHRSGDLAISVEQGRCVANAIPGARFVELPGDDHHVWIGDQDAVLDEVQRFVSELGPAPAVERALATVLFTDIVASTETASRLGDRRWRDVLEQHHRLVREQLERCGGEEVRTVGDGFLATFSAPAGGIRCAQAISAAVQPLGIDVRAGVHTGECELIDGEVGGIAVVIGARITDLAGPAEVLVSQTVKDLVAGSGLEFEDRGVHTLKGVPDEWRLYVAPAHPTTKPSE